MIEQLHFDFNDRLWNEFTYFFRRVKGYDDWTDNEIWFSMNQGDIDEFMEYHREEFDLEEAKENLNDLIKQENELRHRPHTRSELFAIKKQIADIKADIADYVMCLA